MPAICAILSFIYVPSRLLYVPAAAPEQEGDVLLSQVHARDLSRSGVCLSFLQTLAGLLVHDRGRAAAQQLTTSQVSVGGEAEGHYRG